VPGTILGTPASCDATSVSLSVVPASGRRGTSTTTATAAAAANWLSMAELASVVQWTAAAIAVAVAVAVAVTVTAPERGWRGRRPTPFTAAAVRDGTPNVAVRPSGVRIPTPDSAAAAPAAALAKDPVEGVAHGGDIAEARRRRPGARLRRGVARVDVVFPLALAGLGVRHHS
jgi:hypothetical protein